MYHPHQNGIMQATQEVRYFETKPPDTVAHLVYCFWTLKTDRHLARDFLYRVLPDACVDIVFRIDRYERAIIMTPATTATEIDLGREFYYVGIRLLPGVWRGPIKGVVGGQIEVDKIGEKLVAEVVDALRDASSIKQSSVLTELIIKNRNLFQRHECIAKIIAQCNMIKNVSDMAAAANLSPRQLQRLLKQATGFSPHDFLKVIRLQQTFTNDYRLFYADQSHFINSFRLATGYTPGQYKQVFRV